MQNEVARKDFDMPQLRQMVLKNTERIDRNELMINQMRMENMEFARKAAERDEWLENSRKEHDRWARHMRETLDEIAQITKQSQIEQEKRERAREQERQLREREREQERQERDREQEKRKRELDALFAETDRQLKETSLEVKRLSRQLSGTTGHIVEGLVSSSTERIFQKAGLELHNSGRNLKRSIPSEKIAMEVDVLLSNEEMAIPVEVKANCTEANVKRFLHQMGHFRRLFPEYDGKEVYAAMAAINYEKGAAELAHKEKLLVIRVNSDDIFSIDSFEREDLRKF
ncbi:MAG: hypothetical protein IKN78_09280 [Bacteroidales bacterium]|nr:hypothetical protein [Bacteroidales bacterium]